MPNVPHLGATLVKVVVPLIAIAAVILVPRFRRLPPGEILGLTKPALGKTVLWLAVYAAYILGTNYFMNWRGPWDFSEWRLSPLIVDVLRVLAVGVLGPVAEELIFRGVLYTRLLRTRMGPVGAIVLTAVVWGGIHIDYTANVIALLMVAGLLLGTARYKTGSVVPPILMHIMWNLYAVW